MNNTNNTNDKNDTNNTNNTNKNTIINITDKKLNNINQLIQYNNLYHFLNCNKEESLKIQNFIENEGSIIYKKNNFFKDLHNLMKNPEFKQFYDKYFENWFDIEMMIMYMKLYESIKQSYLLKFNQEIPFTVLLFILREVIRNNETRRMIIDNFELFKKGLIRKINFKKLKKIKKLKEQFNKELQNL